MNKKSSLNNLLYIQEHRSCRNYLEKVENGFKYIEFSHEEVILEKKFHGTIFYLFSKENVSSIVISLENVCFRLTVWCYSPKRLWLKLKS